MWIYKNRLFGIFTGLLIFSILTTCVSIPPVVVEDQPPDTAAFDRENIPPNQIAMAGLEAAAERAQAARQQVINNGGPSSIPDDWKLADSLFAQAKQQENTATLRDTQESIARYNMSAEIFQSLNDKAISLLPESEQQKILALAVTKPETTPPETVQQDTLPAPEAITPPPAAAPVISETPSPVIPAAAPEATAAVATPEPEIAQPSAPPAVPAALPEPTPEVTQTSTAPAEAPVQVQEKIPAPVVSAAVPESASTAIPAQSAAPAPVQTQTTESQLPAQYKVRPWQTSNDCFWNIAAKPGVYNDARKWKILYEANKSRMPDPDNPNLIKPGMILQIPAIKGETRGGLWDENISYPDQLP